MKLKENPIPEWLAKIPLETTSIPFSDLNIEEKTRSNLFPWTGQFSPQLIATLLEKFAHPNDVVLDPFVGSGTVLVEAARYGLKAVGTDINPAPVKFANLYKFINVGKNKRKQVLDLIGEKLHANLPDDWFQPTSEASDSTVRRNLVSLARRPISQEYDGEEIADIEQIRDVVGALIAIVDFQKPRIEVERVFSCWKKLRTIITNMPYSKKKITVENCDARQLPLADSVVDLVVTSPPYINVLNYHQKYRRSMEALGWDLLHVARSEIGSNRKNRGNRFLTVIQYCLDMTAALVELSRVCKSTAHIIIVLGRESNVRKTAFYNGDLIVRLAQRCLGLNVKFRQERVFTNRFGSQISEDILHLSSRLNRDSIKENSLDIAKEVLIEAQSYAPNESLSDLCNAIHRADQVAQSPIYTHTLASSVTT